MEHLRKRHVPMEEPVMRGESLDLCSHPRRTVVRVAFNAPEYVLRDRVVEILCLFPNRTRHTKCQPKIAPKDSRQNRPSCAYRSSLLRMLLSESSSAMSKLAMATAKSPICSQGLPPPANIDFCPRRSSRFCFLYSLQSFLSSPSTGSNASSGMPCFNSGSCTQEAVTALDMVVEE